MLFTWICCLKFQVERTYIFSPVLPFTCFHSYSMCITQDVIHVNLSSKILRGKAMDIFTSFTLHGYPHLCRMDYTRCYSRGFVVWNFPWKSHGYFHQFYPSWVSTSIPHGLNEKLFVWIYRLKFHVEKTWIFPRVLPFTCFHIYSTRITRGYIHVDFSSKISRGIDMEFTWIHMYASFHQISPCKPREYLHVCPLGKG